MNLRFARIIFTLFGAFMACESADAQSTANTSYWTGAAGDGRWNTVGNWNFGASNLPADTRPQSQPDNSQHNVLFSSTSGTTTVIALNINPPVPTSIGNISGWANFMVRQGTFSFALNGRDLTVADLALGSSDGATNGAALFTNSSSTQSVLTSSQVVVQGRDHTYSFGSLVTNLAGSLTGNILLDAGGVEVGGLNNKVIVGAGDTLNRNGRPLTINPGSATASSNNQVEMTGGTLTTGEVTIQGFYDASNPGNIISSNNRLYLHNVATLTVLNQTTPKGITIGAGSELRLETASTVNAGYLSVAEHGKGSFDGAGTAGHFVDLDVNGELSISNGANVAFTTDPAFPTSGGAMNVGATGHLTVNNATLSYSKGWTVDGQVDLNKATVTLGTGGVNVRDTAHVSIDGASHVTGSNSTLVVAQGSSFAVKGGSDVQIGNLSVTYYLNTASSSDPAAGNVMVEDGSAFRFERLTSLIGNKSNNKNTYDLNVNGRVTWGAGGAFISPGNGDRTANLRVNAGTTLILVDGGNYRLSESGTPSDHGTLILNGGALEGSATIQAGVTAAPGSAIRPGTSEGAGRLAFQSGLTITGNSMITFTINGPGLAEYDQIATGSGSFDFQVGSGTRIALELTQDLLASSNEDFAANFPPGQTTFKFFTDLNGDPIRFDHESGMNTGIFINPANITFDFGNSVSKLAQNGLAWDTSTFYSTGSIGIVAVPEPGSAGLLILGLCGLLALHRWRVRHEKIPQGSILSVQS